MTKNDMQGDHPSEAKADATGLTPADLATVFAEVRTARLALRRPHPGDSPAMFAVHGDPLTNQHNPAGPDPNPETSEGTLRDWLRRWEIDGYGYWAVARVGTEGIIGFGGVERQTLRDRDVLNLYYRLTSGVWRQGYATELTQTAVGLAQAYLPHLPVIARTRPHNIASQRTAERAGLRRRPDLDTEQIVFALGWTPISEPAERA
jgi:ribosomal-protein-alanine N-acetyltransferase